MKKLGFHLKYTTYFITSNCVIKNQPSKLNKDGWFFLHLTHKHIFGKIINKEHTF